jgi:hypothetical protein
MYKNIYFDAGTWELFESLRVRRGLSRGAFIRELLFAFIRAEGGTN